MVADDIAAVLGCVADAVPHVTQPAFIQQIDDQLELVQAFKVGDLRLIAGFDQRFEAGADQRGDAATEHDLFAEKIGLGLFLEGRLDDAGARTADRFGVS